MMEYKMIRRARCMAAAFVAVTVLATCGGAASSPQSVAVSGGEFDPNAILRITSSAPTRNLDPHLQTSYGGWSYLTPIFDRLTTVDAEGNLVPGLAESWAFASDGSYLELALRDDVVFHDGTPFDATAVAANIQRGQTIEGSAVARALKSIASVEVADDRTVRLELAPGSGVELPGVFSTNAGMMLSPKAINEDLDLRNDPGKSGSGAYVVASYVPEESVKLVRAEGKNWDPEAGKVAGIEFEWIADGTTRLNGLKTGVTDLTWASSVNEVAEGKALAARGALTLNEVRHRNLFGVYMRPQGDLAKTEIRQAVAAAIDPEAISQLFSGTCVPHRQAYPMGSWSADEKYEYPYQFDLEKAKSLVQSAGGANVTLTFAAGTNTEKPSNVIQAMLTEAGIDAELNPVPNTQNEPRYVAGDFQTMVANSFSPRVDPAETVSTYVIGAYDFGNGNPRIAEIATKAANPTLSQEERAPLYHEIWDLTLKEAMFVPICNQITATMSNGRVTGTEDMPWVNLGIFDVRHVGMIK